MRIRSPRALPLNDDLIDHILTFLPNLADLQSTILSSKAFFGVFSARPSSFVKAVAYNEIGPALPEALRVFRYKVTDPWPEDVGGQSPITCAEARSLTRNAAVVKGLEGLYSSRHVVLKFQPFHCYLRATRYKDRSSKTSKLNFMESWRFHRAMYTLTLFTALFPGNELYHEREISNMRRKHAERTAFLMYFSSNELSEIYSASLFLVMLMRWSVIAREGDGLCKSPSSPLGPSLQTALELQGIDALTALGLLPLVPNSYGECILKPTLSKPLVQIWRKHLKTSLTVIYPHPFRLSGTNEKKTLLQMVCIGYLFLTKTMEMERNA